MNYRTLSVLIGLILSSSVQNYAPALAQSENASFRITKDLLRETSTQALFLQSCTTQATQVSGISEVASRQYCQCTLDGLLSDRVSDEQLAVFFNNASQQALWPTAVIDIVTDCNQMLSPKSTRQLLKSDKGRMDFMASCVKIRPQNNNFEVAQLQKYCQCSLDRIVSDQISDQELATFVKHASDLSQWPASIQRVITQCAGENLS